MIEVWYCMCNIVQDVKHEMWRSLLSWYLTWENLAIICTNIGTDCIIWDQTVPCLCICASWLCQTYVYNSFAPLSYRINFRSYKNCCVIKLYIDYVKDGALQVVGYQIPPQLFKLRLYISTIFMHMSGTCDVRSTIIYVL